MQIKRPSVFSTYTTDSWFTKIKPGIKSQFLVYHCMYIYFPEIKFYWLELNKFPLCVVWYAVVTFVSIISFILSETPIFVQSAYIISWWRKFSQGVTIPAAQLYITLITLHQYQYQYTSNLTLSFTSSSNIAATFCLSGAALIRHPLMM